MRKSTKLAWGVVIFFLAALYVLGTYALPYIMEHTSISGILPGG